MFSKNHFFTEIFTKIPSFRSPNSREPKERSELIDFLNREDIWVEFKKVNLDFTPLLQLPFIVTNYKVERKVSNNRGSSLFYTFL